MRVAALITAGLVAATLVTGVGASSAATFDGNVRVSGTPTVAWGDEPIAISPTGETVVWTNLVEGDASGQRRIIVADLDGSAVTPRVLTPVIDSHDADASLATFTPDGAQLVFRGDLLEDQVNDLWIVPVDGSAEPRRLTDEFVLNGDVGSFVLSPDGTTAVIVGDLRVNDTAEIFVVPLDGSAPPEPLDPAPVAGGSASVPTVTNDGARVVYRGDLDVVGRVDLYSAPLDGSAPPVTISQSATGLGILTFAYTGGADVVYRGELTIGGEVRVYVRDILAAGPQSVMSQHLIGGSDASSVRLTPDGTTALWNGPLWEAEIDLFSRPVDLSSGVVRLNLRDVTTTGDVSPGYIVTPDSSRVLYRADLFAANETELFSSPVDGSQPMVRLSPPAGGPQEIFGLSASADSAWAVFNLDIGAGPDVWARPTDGTGVPVEVSDNDQPGGEAVVDAMTADNRVLYLSDEDVLGTADLWSRDVAASTPAVKISELEAGQAVEAEVALAPDESYLVYLANVDVPGESTVLATSRGLPPAPVSDLVASEVCPDRITVAWTASPGSDIARHGVTITPSAGGAAVATTIAGDATTATFTDLAAATPYDIDVTAINAAGASTPVQVTATTFDGGVVRLSGDDRYETAAAIALNRFTPAEVDVVYLAVGTNFPDALAGGPLAAAMGAPILLTRTEALPAATAAALTTLDPVTVVALGGPVAITDVTLAAAGTAAGATTGRLSGGNRFATAAAIAAELPTGFDTVYLATGRNFPDALAGGPATSGAPILLTDTDVLPAATASMLAALAPDTVVALGGPVAISADVLGQAATAAGASDERVSGPDRYATAVEIAGLVPTPTVVYVAVGTNFPDALAASPAAAAEGAPIVLTTTDELPQVVESLLADLGVCRIVILGGAVAVSEAVATTLATLLT